MKKPKPPERVFVAITSLGPIFETRKNVAVEYAWTGPWHEYKLVRKAKAGRKKR